jgi:LPS-assembly lipoprotein
MSSSSDLFRRGLLALALLPALAAVSACTLTPVYGDKAVASQELALNFGTPHTRIEQVIYQALSFRLGGAPSPDAPLVTIIASNYGTSTALSVTQDPAKPSLATVTASVVVTKDGKVLQAFSRTATAGYTTSGQVLADNSAVIDASERAAKEVAETIRLSLIALLMGHNSPQ